MNSQYFFPDAADDAVADVVGDELAGATMEKPLPFVACPLPRLFQPPPRWQ